MNFPKAHTPQYCLYMVTATSALETTTNKTENHSSSVAMIIPSVNSACLQSSKVDFDALSVAKMFVLIGLDSTIQQLSLWDSEVLRWVQEGMLAKQLTRLGKNQIDKNNMARYNMQSHKDNLIECTLANHSLQVQLKIRYSQHHLQSKVDK